MQAGCEVLTFVGLDDDGKVKVGPRQHVQNDSTLREELAGSWLSA